MRKMMLSLAIVTALISVFSATPLYAGDFSVSIQTEYTITESFPLEIAPAPSPAAPAPTVDTHEFDAALHTAMIPSTNINFDPATLNGVDLNSLDLVNMNPQETINLNGIEQGSHVVNNNGVFEITK